MKTSFSRPPSRELRLFAVPAVGIFLAGCTQAPQYERLCALVALALENNRDLRISSPNVEQLRAQYRIQRASLLPAIDATFAASRSRASEDLVGAGASGLSPQYSAGVGMTSW